MTGNHDIEEGNDLSIDFSKLKTVSQCGENVVPVVIQDDESKRVLTVAYANEQALKQTLDIKLATLWSTSRNELWVKGAQSGDLLDLVDVRINCEQNSLLYLVRPRKSGACHTVDQNGQTRPTCFYRRLDGDHLEFI